MSCKACAVGGLQFEIKMEGEVNHRIYLDVVHRLERNGQWVEAQEKSFVVKEAGMRDFLDFCYDHLKRILAFYKEKGFCYALDDVGKGYSTLEMLTDLQPHYMKRDMKYVHGVSRDMQKQQIALAFLEQAMKLGAVPLAEGIETREDFEWLKENGYQLFQGYLFGKPLQFNHPEGKNYHVPH